MDNYESPNGGIKGQILDAETNEPIPLPVQGSTGVIINMFEQRLQILRKEKQTDRLQQFYNHS